MINRSCRVLPLSEITSLSNRYGNHSAPCRFYHYQKLHHSQTAAVDGIALRAFYHYQKLHHSQTGAIGSKRRRLFYHYQKLHHSQTRRCRSRYTAKFYHYQKLHHSQTSNCIFMQRGRPQAVPPSRGGAISDRVSSSKNLAQVPIDDEEFLRFHYIMTNPLQQEK